MKSPTTLRPSRFARRSSADEWMDDPSIGGPELEAALRQLTRINRLLGGYAPSVAGVLGLLGGAAPHPSVLPRTARLLDVGTGAADTPRRLIEACAARGTVLHVTAIDLAAHTVAYAQRHSAAHPSLNAVQADLLAIDADAPGARFDVVHAAMVLHHFRDDDAVRALARMYALAEFGVIVNDLHRHPLAYWGFRALAAVAFRNRMIRHDGPVSVLRGFRRAELRALAARAGWPMDRTRLRWWPLFRWQLVADKRGTAARTAGR